MSFDHATYWLAVATAAPVIALTGVIAFADGLRWSDRFRRPADTDDEVWTEEMGRKWHRLGITATACAGLVVGTQIVFMAFALAALQLSRDVISPLIVTAVEPLVFAPLYLGSAVNGDLKALRRRVGRKFD